MMYPINNEEELIAARDEIEYLLNKDKYNALAMEVIENYPEYSSEWIRCIKVNKDVYTFNFENPDTDEFEESIVKGCDIAHAIPRLIREYRDSSYMDPCSWDQEDTDMLMQLHFYGEVVFS